MFVHDDVDIDIDLWSLSAESVRRYSCAAETVKKISEVAVFTNVHNLNREDSHGRKMFIDVA